MLQTRTRPKGKNISLPPESSCLLHQLLPLGTAASEWLSCVWVLPLDPTPAALGEPSSRLAVSSGRPPRAPSGKEVASPALGGEICLLRLSGSWEVGVGSWLAWHPLANRLVIAKCKGERASPAPNRNPSSLPISLKVRQKRGTEVNAGERGGERVACWKPGVTKITFRYKPRSLPGKQDKLKTFPGDEHLPKRPLSFGRRVHRPLAMSVPRCHLFHGDKEQ